MTGENAESRIYLGIHYQFDANEGIRTGDGVGDYVFTHALKPLHGPGPVAMPLMDPLQQIRLSVLLEDVAAKGGLPMGRPQSTALVIAEVFLNPSVRAIMENLFSNPPPAQPSSLSPTSAGTSAYSAAKDGVFWWNFETGRTYSAVEDVLGLMISLEQDLIVWNR
jgi:hypothetical protein